MSGDLISRDAVIDIIHRFFTEEVDKIPTKKTEDGEVLIMCKAQPLFAMNKTLCKRIKALPSVTAEEQEPCEDSNANQYNSNALNALEGDAISRQAVLDLIEHYNSDGLGSVFYGYEEGVKFADAVNKLPSVKQEQSSSENPNKWISVGEKLPELNKPLLVTAYHRVCYAHMISENGNYGYPIFRLHEIKDSDRGWVQETISHEPYSKGRIDAWMYIDIPEPYKIEPQERSEKE